MGGRNMCLLRFTSGGATGRRHSALPCPERTAKGDDSSTGLRHMQQGQGKDRRLSEGYACLRLTLCEPPRRPENLCLEGERVSAPTQLKICKGCYPGRSRFVAIYAWRCLHWRIPDRSDYC